MITVFQFFPPRKNYHSMIHDVYKKDRFLTAFTRVEVFFPHLPGYYSSSDTVTSQNVWRGPGPLLRLRFASVGEELTHGNKSMHISWAPHTRRMSDDDDSDEDDSPEDDASTTSGDYTSPELQKGLYPGT